jgi:prevent-host-death family protein
MNRVLLDQDVKPLSEFRANTASFIAQIKESKRPLLLTQHGKGTAVLLDVQEYERILEEIEVLRDINVAREELAQGKGIPHTGFKKRILKKYQVEQ